MIIGKETLDKYPNIHFIIINRVTNTLQVQSDNATLYITDKEEEKVSICLFVLKVICFNNLEKTAQMDEEERLNLLEFVLVVNKISIFTWENIEKPNKKDPLEYKAFLLRKLKKCFGTEKGINTLLTKTNNELEFTDNTIEFLETIKTDLQESIREEYKK